MIRKIIAYAVVKKKNPKLKVSEIYEDKDITLNKDEEIIKVEINERKRLPNKIQ
jgi:hypothetical protein